MDLGEENEFKAEAAAKSQGATDVFDKIRNAAMARHGYSGIKSIGRVFGIYDEDGNTSWSREEFAKGLQDCGLQLTHAEFEVNAIRLNSGKETFVL